MRDTDFFEVMADELDLDDSEISEFMRRVGGS
jgi:hypothetical protein